MRPVMDKSAPKAIHLKDYAPPPYLIDSVDLAFDLGEEVTRVKSSLNVIKLAGARPLVVPG
jgi:aminopeptidase N